jgi:hypothetical protein
VVAAPDLTLTLTPPGGSPAQYQHLLAYEGHDSPFTIAQNFGRQGDTAVLPLADDYSGGSPALPYVQPMTLVSLYDGNCGQVLFAGVCHDPLMTVVSPRRNDWTLNCTDYTYYADNAIVHGVFNGLTADQVIIGLTNQADCGISAARRDGGGFVADGPAMANLVLNYGSLSSAWRKLAVLAGASTPYGWYVDENRALHFYDATTALDSGVTFTAIPTTGGSTTQGHMLDGSSNTYEWDGTSVHNRILVQGGTQTIPQPVGGASTATDTWRADGTQQAWPLRYTVSGTPTLHVGGVRQPVTVVTPGTAFPSSGWSLQQNAFGGFFLWKHHPAPPAGTLLQTWYSYSVPVVAQATDHASVARYAGPNGGIFAEFISDTTLTTAPMALSRAQQERTEYAFAAERASFTTAEDFLGWVRAGQVFRYVNPYVPDSQNSWAPGISDTFLAVANTVTFGKGGYRQMAVTGVRI